MKCPKCGTENASDSCFCSRCGTQILSPDKPVPFTRTLTLRTPLKELAGGSVFARRYQVIEELGKGGMGLVYKAYDTDIREQVALKILNPEIASDEDVIERFRNELKFARKISHRNVCRMYDLGREEDTTYISMEYVPGEDLKSLLRRIGRFTVERTVSIARQVCEGLAEAHRLGVVHRDLKPQNIMIDREGNARIMDFGIARSVKAKGPTDTGVIMGTPEYMSPEQLDGMEADQPSDIYSLGAILYEMVTGDVPFKGETPLVIALKHKTEKPRDPRELNPHVPEELSRLILRCLEKDKGKRYSSAESILTDLENIERETASARGVPAGKRRRIPLLRRRGRPVRQRWLIPGVVSGLAVAVALVFIIVGHFQRADKPEAAKAAAARWKSSIAVLPFEDLSPEKDQEHFCNGITEDLITKLASIGQLKVISRTSVMRYRGQSKEIREIGKELGVETILEGSIQREKDNIRINVQLIDARDGSHIWAESYDRKLQSIFAVQDEISRSIVNALRIELVAGQEYMLVKRYTQDPDAYNIYLEGRFLWSKRTEDGLKKSIELFREAVTRDPDFALAYAGVADGYNMLGSLAFLPSREAYPKAKEAAEKALEMDHSLAEGYISMAFVKAHFDWDWMGAEIDFNWAIGLNPSYAAAYHWYGEILAYQGRFDEALAKLERAVELDPRSLSINTAMASLLFYSRRYDQAVKQCRSALKIDPGYHWAHSVLGAVYCLERSISRALKEFEKAENLSGNRGLYLADIAYVRALSGKRDEAREILENLVQSSGKRPISTYQAAIIHAALGDQDRAFEYLEKASEERTPGIVSIRVDPRLDGLHDDPRYAALLEKMGLK